MAAQLRAAPGAQTLLEALPDAVIVADAAGHIVYANAAVSALLGHRPEQLLGRPLTVLMPERFRAAHAAGFAHFLSTGRGELLGVTTQVPGLHADGEEVPLDLTLSPLTGEAAGQVGGVVPGGVAVGVLRDARATVLLERQLHVSSYLAAILRVTAALAAAPDAETAFAGLLPALCEQLDWDAATLWQPDPHAHRLHHAGTWTAPGRAVAGWSAASPEQTFTRGQGLPGLAWRHRGPVVIDELGEDGRIPRAAAARADGLHTGVAFPLLHDQTLLGVCELLSRTARPVPTELLEVLAGAGRQIGQFLGRLRAESDLRGLADTLQRSLLPAGLPAIPGVELAVGYRPAGLGMLVGGDTYDILALPDGRWMALIADVCGSGAHAAALTALTRHTARAAAAAGNPPGQILAAVNAALLADRSDGPLRFVTACCLLLRFHEGCADGLLSVAGHPHPLLRTHAGTTTELGSTDRPLGIDADAVFRETTVHLGPGDILVLYTDGATESRNEAGEQFGEEHLRQIVSRDPALSAQGAAEAITVAVARHEHHSPRADDLAVLVLHLPRPTSE
jgi:sigma-B regulation protein RsbU (phosphoserine phosphatase)